MAPFSANSPESFEDHFFRERLQSGDLSPGEFAEQVGRRSSVANRLAEQEARQDLWGPLYRRGVWSPLRRAWLCLQGAVVAGLLAAYLDSSGAASVFVTLALVVAASSLSLGILLLARSSAVYEIRLLTRDRNTYRKQAKAHALYAEALTECVSWVHRATPSRHDSGAIAIRGLLEQSRRALVAAGHGEAALLLLRHESECALIAYSALSPGNNRDLAPHRSFTSFELKALRDDFAGCYSAKLDFSDCRQELLALSGRPFERCDVLALDHLAACISLTATRSLVA